MLHAAIVLSVLAAPYAEATPREDAFALHIEKQLQTHGIYGIKQHIDAEGICGGMVAKNLGGAADAVKATAVETCAASLKSGMVPSPDRMWRLVRVSKRHGRTLALFERFDDSGLSFIDLHLFDDSKGLKIRDLHEYTSGGYTSELLLGSLLDAAVSDPEKMRQMTAAWRAQDWSAVLAAYQALPTEAQHPPFSNWWLAAAARLDDDTLRDVAARYKRDFPASVAGALLLFDAYYVTEDWDAMFDALDTLDAYTGGTAGLASLRASTQYSLGELENAVASYQRAIDLDVRLAGSWDNLIAIQMELGQLDEALASARTAYESGWFMPPSFADVEGYEALAAAPGHGDWMAWRADHDFAPEALQRDVGTTYYPSYNLTLGKYGVGVAFPLQFASGQTLFVTPHHAFGTISGLPIDHPPEQIPGLIKRVKAYPSPDGKPIVFGDYVPVEQGIGHTEACRLDLAAFASSKPVQSPFTLAKTAPELGDTVFLVASGYTPYAARVVRDEVDCLTYVFAEQVNLNGLNGSPIVNTDGEVVGMHLGAGFQYNAPYGIANPSLSVVVNLPEEVVGPHPTHEWTPPPIELEDRPVLLWRIDKGDAISYLRAQCAGAAIPKSCWTLSNESRVVIAEVTLDDRSPMEVMGMMWRGADEGTLREQLSAGAWRALIQRARNTVPATMLNHLHPWAAVTMATPRDAQSDDDDTGDATDAPTVERIYLDTPEESVRQMAQHSVLILQQIENAEATAAVDWDMTEALDRMCRTGDTAGIDALHETKGHLDLRAPIVAARVAKWLERIAPEIDRGDAYITLPVETLMGSGGMIQRLRDRGFEIEQLHGEVPRSEWMPTSGSPPPVTPPDAAEAERVAHWSAALSDEILSKVCGDDSTVRKCLLPERALCEERVATDIEMCALQQAHALTNRGKDLPPHLRLELTQCASVGVMMNALFLDNFQPDDECQTLRDDLRTSVNKSKSAPDSPSVPNAE